MMPSIVLLGNLLADDVAVADGATRMGQAGGALLYSALGATFWGTRPGLVSVVGDDYPAGVLQALQHRDRQGFPWIGAMTPSRTSHQPCAFCRRGRG